VRATAVLVLTLSLGACRPSAEDDLKPPPGFQPPPIRIPRAVALHANRPSLRAGFFGRELDREGHSWNWMGARGEIELPRAPGGARLRIIGWVPREFLPAAPEVRITLTRAGLRRELDRFTPEQEVAREWELPDELIGRGPATLVIETSAVGVPPHDGRTLGLAIRSLEWQLLRP
jgi:hypothetical protein